MPDAYGLPETRFVQHIGTTSAANGHQAALPKVPQGKIWTVLNAYLQPSVDETQVVWFGVLDPTGYYTYPITAPVSQAFDVSEFEAFPMLREGMEFRLYPGETLYALRSGHTVGSTITIRARIIESDMPLYVYDEPQIIKRRAQAVSEVQNEIGRRAAGGSVISGGGPILGGKPPGPRPK